MKGWSVEQVAQSIGYSRVHLQKEMTKGENQLFIELLKNHHYDILQSVSRETHGKTGNAILEAGMKLGKRGTDQERYIELLERDRMFFETTLKENMNLMAANLTELLRSQRYDRAQLTTLLAVTSRTLAKVEKRAVETVFEETNKALNDQIREQM